MGKLGDETNHTHKYGYRKRYPSDNQKNSSFFVGIKNHTREYEGNMSDRAVGVGAKMWM